jgi:tetratricopeptide (TPR) repeat protein
LLLAREYRRPFWAHHLATRASRGVSLVAMGADPHDLPSGFSVVSDSIRRDREALFGATRLDVPTIADGDDSSDGSDVEAPVFFTTTGSDAEAEAEGFGGPLPPGLLSPKQPDFASGAARSRTGLLREDVRGRTDRDRDRDRDGERRTPSSSAAADDEAAALAAFELAAERALREEEARSNRLVRAHLREARGGRLDGTDDDEEKASRSDAPSDDEREASSSSDDDVSVRARRRPPPRPKGRHAARNTLADPRDERATNETARTEKTNDAFRGWLSGAAGRLARDDDTSARGEKRDSKTPGGFSPEETNDDAKHDFHVNDDASEEVASETALTNAFFAQTAGNAIAPSSALDERNAFGAPPPRASLDLGSALGGLDLDGLLSRLEAPGGEAVVARLRERSSSAYVDLALLSSGDEKDEARTSDETSARQNSGGDDGVLARRRRDVEGWVVSNGRRGDVSVRPRTARVERSTERARERTSEKTREGEDAFGSRSFRNQNADPYGRGTRRGRQSARPQSASPSTFSETPTGTRGDSSGGGCVGRPSTGVFVRVHAAAGARHRPHQRLGHDGREFCVDAKRRGGEKSRRRRRRQGALLREEKSSPSALLAESASRRAADASRAAREAAARASLEADARERADAARVRAASDEKTRVSPAEAEAKVTKTKKLLREKTITPAFPTTVSETALASAEALRAEGNACFRKGDLESAVAKFTEALTVVPNDVSALANRSAAFLKLLQFAQAERDASACLAIDAKHEKALHRRAKARTELGDHRGASCDLEALLELLPNHAETAAAAARARRAAEMAGAEGEGASLAAARMEEREAARRRAEEEEAARWEARRVAGIQAHMERAKAAVRVSRK